MGHYASEMSGPYRGPTNEEVVTNKVDNLRKEWDWRQELLNTGYHPSSDGGDYSCPVCYAKVNYWLLAKHDEWHRKFFSR